MRKNMRMFLFTFLLVLSCIQQGEKMDDLEQKYTELRKAMIKNDIERRGVKDPRVLEALMHVKRHEFVPKHLRKYAYSDEPLPIGEDQTISQPYIVAYMTEHLQLQKEDKVLEIGTGSGYQAAVLAEIVDSVFTIEIIDLLAKRAKKKLESLGYTNIFVRSGDGYAGWPEEKPFDVIIVTAAPERIPQPLVDQLKLGGRMILPVGNVTQELVLIEKTLDGYTKRPLLPVRFVPMTGEIEEHY
jgi:protein-L-isoaspartate(D-aspartate) O-methyltransferase